MNNTELEEALQIFRFLLDHDGKLQNADNPTLYNAFQNRETRDILRSFEEQLDFTFLNTAGTIYLIPHAGNTTLGMSIKEYREDISPNARSIDALTVAYIQMFVCWEFYGGKNADPTRRTFIRLPELTEDVTHLFENIGKEKVKVQEIDNSSQMNFEMVAENWNSKIIRSDNSLSTKEGTVRRALNQMIDHGLLNLVEDTYRPTQAFHDKFIHYYLDEDREQEINQIFEENAGGNTDAENQ